VPVEFWNSLWSFLTFLVIAATVVPAILQIRHLSSGNQIQTLLSLERDFNERYLQEAFRYVQHELPKRLEDPAYRAELARIGYIDANLHPEMKVCNWFDEIGTFVKNGLVGEQAFFELFGRLVDRYWELLMPVIALLRRERGSRQYQNFEFLTARYRRWVRLHPDGVYPKSVPRLKLNDPWLAQDGAPKFVAEPELPIDETTTSDELTLVDPTPTP
jgi:hypothetical protein